MTLYIQKDGQITAAIDDLNDNDVDDHISYILRRRQQTATNTNTNTNTNTSTNNTIWPLTPALVTFGGGRDDGQPYRYESIIYASNVTNLSIVGLGMIYGNGPI
jgi:hypothetical protein